MEIQHVFFFETNVASEVLANNALPRGEELLVEKLLKFLGQIDILELDGPCQTLLDELNSSESHI